MQKEGDHKRCIEEMVRMYGECNRIMLISYPILKPVLSCDHILKRCDKYVRSTDEYQSQIITNNTGQMAGTIIE